jgi:K+-sensing histidine kinase KdpD
MIAGVEEAAMTLLRLIADDAPAAELAEAADRVAAEDPAARDLALRIRSGMDASKRRAAELSALVDVARELASAREPGGVLDTVVHRARTLIGTHVAYLTLYDAARGDTFMRATDGSVSAAFQQLRLSPGARQGERSGRGVRV